MLRCAWDGLKWTKGAQAFKFKTENFWRHLECSFNPQSLIILFWWMLFVVYFHKRQFKDGLPFPWKLPSARLKLAPRQQFQLMTFLSQMGLVDSFTHTQLTAELRDFREGEREIKSLRTARLVGRMRQRGDAERGSENLSSFSLSLSCSFSRFCQFQRRCRSVGEEWFSKICWESRKFVSRWSC